MWRPEMGSWTWSPKKRLGGTAKNKTKQNIPKKKNKIFTKQPWFVWWDEKKPNTNKTFCHPF